MADPSAATAGGEETTTEDKTRQIIQAILLVCLVFVLIGVIALGVTRPPPATRTPVFSVTVSDAVGGLDPERSPLIHPALDLTVRVDNPVAGSRTCWENATATVSSYGGTVLGMGHLFPQLCVEQGASAEVKAALWQVHVMPPDDRLRGLMASKLRAGELELLVHLRMRLVPNRWLCGSCEHEIVLHYCRLSPGQGFSPCNWETNLVRTIITAHGADVKITCWSSGKECQTCWERELK